VLEISEVIGFENGEVALNPLYRFQEQGESNGRIVGGLERCGAGLQHTLKLQMAGMKPESWDRGQQPI
jgi:pilus assembly protein CpaF